MKWPNKAQLHYSKMKSEKQKLATMTNQPMQPHEQCKIITWRSNKRMGWSLIIHKPKQSYQVMLSSNSSLFGFRFPSSPSFHRLSQKSFFFSSFLPDLTQKNPPFHQLIFLPSWYHLLRPAPLFLVQQVSIHHLFLIDVSLINHHHRQAATRPCMELHERCPLPPMKCSPTL